jgi:hypothetical protein
MVEYWEWVEEYRKEIGRKEGAKCKESRNGESWIHRASNGGGDKGHYIIPLSTP